ncbi:MAG: lipopolysaccharide biosynthesis protein, partial [Clostridiales bacterium]
IILKRGVPGILLSQVIGYGLLWFFITIHISFKNGLAFSKEVFIMLMKYGFPLIFAMAGNLIMNTSAVYFLGYFFGLEKVAVYTLAFKIASIAEMSVILPFQLAYEPFVFENLEQPGIKNVIAELTTYLFLIFAFVGFAVVFAFRDLIKLVAPADYYPAYYYVFLILPGVAAQGFHYIGQSLLHIERKTYITGITVSSLSFVSIILNFFFIRMFGIYGLVLIYDLTMFAIAVMLVSQGIKTFRVSFEIKRMVMVLVIFVVLLSAVFVFKNISSFLFYPLMLFVVINMIAFLFWGNFIKPKERLFLLSIGKSVKMSSENMFIRKDSD